MPSVPIAVTRCDCCVLDHPEVLVRRSTPPVWHYKLIPSFINYNFLFLKQTAYKLMQQLQAVKKHIYF